MAYEKQTWEARLGVGLNKFTDYNTGSTLVLTSTPDSITQEGTPFTADRMNHMENGIESAATVADNAAASASNAQTTANNAQTTANNTKTKVDGMIMAYSNGTLNITWPTN